MYGGQGHKLVVGLANKLSFGLANVGRAIKHLIGSERVLIPLQYFARLVFR